jgi:tRNA (cytidine/uridine-2'-O-)-methyltransferase
MSLCDPFLNIVLFEPEIPYNTGNIGRLCVGTNSRLHLIEPLGFKITDKMIKRAGLDYWNLLDLRIHSSISDFFSELGQRKFYFASTKAETIYFNAPYHKGDYIVFGKESAGLPEIFHKDQNGKGLKIPMTDKIRSINLCNSVSVIMYEAYRQNFGN